MKLLKSIMHYSLFWVHRNNLSNMGERSRANKKRWMSLLKEREVRKDSEIIILLFE